MHMHRALVCELSRAHRFGRRGRASNSCTCNIRRRARGSPASLRKVVPFRRHQLAKPLRETRARPSYVTLHNDVFHSGFETLGEFGGRLLPRAAESVGRLHEARANLSCDGLVREDVGQVAGLCIGSLPRSTARAIKLRTAATRAFFRSLDNLFRRRRAAERGKLAGQSPRPPRAPWLRPRPRPRPPRSTTSAAFGGISRKRRLRV